MRIPFSHLFILHDDGKVTTRTPVVMETPHAVVRFPKGITLGAQNRFGGVTLALHRHDDLDVDIRKDCSIIRAILCSILLG
jgi:hypothetical protein